MAIDAVVVGLRKKKGESPVKLTLEPRPGGTPAGQHTLAILNIKEQKPGWLLVLKKLIGCELWGGSSAVYLGEKKLASREGYVGINLVDGWEELIDQQKEEGE